MSDELTYRILPEAVDTRCLLRLEGRIEAENSQRILDRLWDDSDYTAFPHAIWDVSGAELPEFDVLLGVARYVAREKHDRGPAVVAFVAPVFGQSALARAFRGFAQVARLKFNFFASLEAARTWLDERGD